MTRANTARWSHTLPLALVAALLALPTAVLARDVDYHNQEISVHVTPREPTQVQFPGTIAGGFRPSDSSLSLDRKDTDLVIFSNRALTKQGEAIIVRLQDGRSYSLRVKLANDASPRDTIIRIHDKRASLIDATEEEEEPAYKERQFRYAKPTQISGLMREMVLATEFGKARITGYKTSDRFRGEPVLNDGTIKAEIEQIFIGSNLWGYVINASNQLDQAQRINPASFRIDGTRAISSDNWELAPRPMNIEQQIAGRHKARIYLITRAKKTK